MRQRVLILLLATWLCMPESCYWDNMPQWKSNGSDRVTVRMGVISDRDNLAVFWPDNNDNKLSFIYDSYRRLAWSNSFAHKRLC